MFPQIKQFIGKAVTRVREGSDTVPGPYSSPFNDFDLDPVEQKQVDRKLKKAAKKANQ